MNFNKFALLTRAEIWQQYHSGEKPKGGSWDTGYVLEGHDLVAFLNIGAAGRTGHDFDNAYDSEAETVTWFGKPSTHSKQPIFKGLLEGTITPHFFARWDSKNTKFTYLGPGRVLEYQDGVPIDENRTAIRMRLSVSDGAIGEDGAPAGSAQPSFAKKLTMLVNRYERDPAKRLACLAHHGYACQICEFSFEAVYGELGKDFIHVHHIEPLAEVGGEHDIDPIKDLIPVCANCHSMLHRVSPAMKPEALHSILSEGEGASCK